MLDNKEIIRQINLYAAVLELKGENEFRIRSYNNAVFSLERLEEPLFGKSLAELEKMPGIGKAIAAKIDEANREGMFHQLREALENFPPGVIDMLGIEGLGTKKVRILWQELGIEDTEQLLQACENNQIAELKGFGKKTQENIRQALLFRQASANKLHCDEAEVLAAQLEQYLRQTYPGIQLST
ncbi:MAG: hypothetical protein HC880_17420 [Bacteroidia bacterium]|nr:hypothetical protein [Bacteroidia bacterium]